jgi:hypothetical protein
MGEVGPGNDDTAYGWLTPGVKAEDAVSIYRRSGFHAQEMVRNRPPEGVKRAYNRPD